MTTQAVEIGLHASVMLAILLWFESMPVAGLAAVAKVLLVWSVFSTLLVASAGAWVALRRSVARRSLPSRPWG